MAQSLPEKNLYQYNVDMDKAFVKCADPLSLEFARNDPYEFVNSPGKFTGIDKSGVRCDMCNAKYADVFDALQEEGGELSVMKLCDLCCSFNVAWTCMEHQSDECKMEFSDSDDCEDYHNQRESPDDPDEFKVVYNLSSETFYKRQSMLTKGLFYVLLSVWIAGGDALSPTQEPIVELKRVEYDFYSQLVHTLAWYSLALLIVWRIAQILECLRDALVNFNVNCVKLAAWVPLEYTAFKTACVSDYHGTKGWLIREYLELKAQLYEVKETYKKMAMVSLCMQTVMSVLALAFVPLMWCFGRSGTRRYEYQSEGLMKNGYKLGQMFKGLCAFMVLGFLMFGKTKKAAKCKEYWSYMFCNEDAWSFLRNIKRWFQGKEGNIKIPRTFQNEDIHEAVNVAERGFGHTEIPADYEEMAKKEKSKPLPVTKCPECSRVAALTGVMGHPKYVKLCIGCKKRWLESDTQKLMKESKKIDEFEATKRAMGEELWSDVEDTEKDFVQEFNLDVVAEAERKHAATGTELRDTANECIEEIQGVDLMKRQMELNQIEVSEPYIEEVEKVDARAMSQIIIHLETLRLNDQSPVGKAGGYYMKFRKYFLNRVHWTHPTLSVKQFGEYLAKIRSYVTTKPPTEIDEQIKLLEQEAKASQMNAQTLFHIKQTAKRFMEEKKDAVTKAKTVAVMKAVASAHAGKPMTNEQLQADLVRDSVIFAQAADQADCFYPAKTPSPPSTPDDDIQEQTTKPEGMFQSIIERLVNVMVEIVTMRTVILKLTEWEIAYKFGHLTGLMLTPEEQKYWQTEAEQETIRIIKRWTTVRDIGSFVVGFCGTIMIKQMLFSDKREENEVLEGHHGKGSNYNKAKNNRHKKKVRGTKYWDIFKGPSSGNIEAEDIVEILSPDRKEVIDEMTYGEFKNELDARKGRHFQLDGAGRVHFRIASSGYTGYAMSKEGFVNEGVANEVKQVREEIIKTKFAKKRDDRKARREKAIANLRNLKRHYKSKGVCKSCMLKHKGPCSKDKFGVTDSVLDNLAIVHESYVAEGILNKNNFIGSNDYHGRVGKCFIDGEFKMNCHLQSDKVIILRHALGEAEDEINAYKDDKYAQKAVLFKFPSVTLHPKKGFMQYDQIDDFVAFPVQVAQSIPAVPLRKPKVCETFNIMAYLDDRSAPVFTQGVAGINGHHSGSTTYGFCAAPLMSLEDKAIIGWHCAGGERSNRFIPVTDEIIAFLKKPVN